MSQIQRIVFILGAAANIELDPSGSMPVGIELARRIQRDLSGELQSGTRWPDGPISDSLSRSPGLGDSHVKAMRRIENGIIFKESIDEYLDEWRDTENMLEVGKRAICHQILVGERSTKFCLSQENNTTVSPAMIAIRESWLGQILRYANPGRPRRRVNECLNGISFITFNYDRLLEQALYWFIRFGQDQTDEMAKEQFATVPIKHVYGSIGELPVPSGGSIQLGSAAPYDIQKGASSIRTFTEEAQSEHRADLQNLMKHADKVVFLGFGFHRRNIELILPDYFENGEVGVYGTDIGLRQRAKEQVDLSFASAGTSVLFHNRQCGELISEIRDELF